MKIVYFGSDVFLDVFRYLLERHEILALYTYHKGEDYFNEENIVHLARLHEIPVHYTQISEEEMVERIERDGCNLFFVAEYSHKLALPNNPGFRGVNIHSSLLPEGRSYYPIECAMDREYAESGVTIHKLASHLDCGDILAQRCYTIEPKDDSIDLYLKSAQGALEMVKEVMEDFEWSWQNAKPQPKTLSYWYRPQPEDMTIRHEMTVEEAQVVYRKFNKMTMVDISGQRYFVDSFAMGNFYLGTDDQDVIYVRHDRVLYGVADGHVRLDLRVVPTE
ncbi:formyltransferase family protein [Oscillospiraceae bacterium LTW-04]|nr:formyltransferase family protein [Oscillospiraceae bacterium MB24-C1]